MKFEIAPKSTEIQANWDDAKLYCELLVIDNKNDWRLPTKAELNEIYQSENDFNGSFYLSSIECNGGVWGQNMTYGGRYYVNKNASYYVRAIRDIKDNQTITRETLT